jgi:hypothetical protein
MTEALVEAITISIIILAVGAVLAAVVLLGYSVYTMRRERRLITEAQTLRVRYGSFPDDEDLVKPSTRGDG